MADFWIQTYSGRKMSLVSPDPESIVIEDIAHHLALQTRFCGACAQHYTVAQHSVQVAELCGAAKKLEGLLHDAHEAYMGDISRPLKQYLATETDLLIQIAHRLDVAIGSRFGVILSSHRGDVRWADDTMLVTERRDQLGSGPTWEGQYPDPLPQMIKPWHWELAEHRFLEMFHKLMAERDTACAASGRDAATGDLQGNGSRT